ncbi:uncharacterized protein LOC124899598 [Capsicum annuum]|uniref:uncharacterized protein LOC124899598 n=1 Tax=Capsicum annuum TaxID=4072 RepID=UPI001FB0831B|nr:uncharacterized protein LOC124899598 [Capsicum annuum]
MRGQGYDGASNMQGEMNDLKALILQETPSAYCIHCFAHQLQLTLVAVAKKHLLVDNIFAIINNVLNVVGASFKRRDQLRDHHAEMLEQLLESESQSVGLLVLLTHITYVLSFFYAIIDLQLQEINNRFDVVSGNLLLGMASLNPMNAFANFDKEKIMILAKHYPDEFGESKLRELGYQLDTFIIHMRRGNPIFSNLKGIGDLAEALVNANFVETYSLVYILVKLMLILPVATATVERAFSSMKHIKNELLSNIGDAFLSDCLVCYIKKDIFININNDVIIDYFQNMKTRRCLV